MLKESIHLWPARREVYRAKFAFSIFLAMLGMMFAAGLVAFWFLTFTQARRENPIVFEAPLGLWLSTLLLIGVSGLLHWSVRLVRFERQRRFRQVLIAALIVAAAFASVQGISLVQLLAEHDAHRESQVQMYGVVASLVLLHAAHVFGGLIALLAVAARAWGGRYDHECHWPVDLCAAYWHFLDVMWLLMLLSFVLTL